jgi:hypothetical protein
MEIWRKEEDLGHERDRDMLIYLNTRRNKENE